MNRLEQTFKKATKNIYLGTTEKALMREHLVMYMEHKPIRRVRAGVEPFPAFRAISFFKLHHFQGALVVALLATVGTFGVSSAADSALPGDLLYPVKVNVNEEIKTVFLGSDADELRWQSERAELRLKEAGQLAVEGRLSTKNQETVAKLLAEHTDAVNEKVHAIEASNPALAVEVSSDLEASLGTHEAVLARLLVERGGTDSNDPGRTLVELVRTSAEEAEQARAGAEQLLVASQATSTNNGVESTEVDAVNGSSSKTSNMAESANLRESAVYRIQERSSQSLAQAREQLAKLDQDSDLARQATRQIATGEALIAQGTAALADYELGQAYSFYRRADMIFQKVTRLLEALNEFSVQTLQDTVAEELPAVSSTTDGVVEPTMSDETTPDITTIREGTQAMLGETRSLLLTVDGVDETVVFQANSFMKDSMAHIMRADIAFAAKDEKDARTLFMTANTQAERAFKLVSRAVRNLGGVNVLRPESTASNADGASFVLTHRYADGMHVWNGTIDIPTPCATLETGSFVTESVPTEQITLTFNLSQQQDNSERACVQSIDVVPFEIRVAASPEAQLVGVTVNGINRAWSVTEGN